MTVLIKTLPRLWLEIEGEGRFEVAQFNADFVLNQIPRATCTLAVGRRAVGGTAAAKIHSSINNLKRALVAKVYFEARGSWDGVTDWPSGTHTIFDGKILGTGFQKVSGKIAVSVFLIHWLADMNFTSILHSRSHPIAETDIAFPAIRESLLGRSTGIASSKSAISGSAEGRFLRSDRISDDLWGSAIKPFFCGLAKDEHVRITPKTITACGAIVDGSDSAALKALSRIEGSSDFVKTDCDLERSCYTPPLSLTPEGGTAIPEEVAQAIATAIGSQGVEAFSGQTAWSKLLQYGGEFMFAIVPQVDRALVVAATAGLRQTYCKTISADEYGQVSITGQVRRPIRAVALVASRRGSTGLYGGGIDATTPVVANGIGGCFAPSGISDSEGVIVFARPPDWLQNVPTSNMSLGRTTGRRGRRITSSATTPVATIDTEVRGTRSGKMVDTVTAEAREVFNGFAHAYYVREVLRGRIGHVPGKLRFDIAPGATVIVGGSAERFLPASSDGQNIIGLVVGVGIAIDAETPAASTTFQLNYCRTEKENADERTSLERHPLFTGDSFAGAPLIPELWFPEDTCCK